MVKGCFWSVSLRAVGVMVREDLRLRSALCCGWLQQVKRTDRAAASEQMRTVKHNAELMVFAKEPCLPTYLPPWLCIDRRISDSLRRVE